MANLPTAYASQRFGRKTLDFYAVEGEVVGADPRARSEERRLEDMDGQRHTVRLMEKGFELEPGQTATVLRMQPGPARRSRPVAVVNHDTGRWSRTHPGAEGLLAKAGVSRTFNWLLTIGLFALAALALVWPFLRSFLVEVDPSMFGATPNLNVAELAAGALPALASWSFSDAIAPLTAPLVAALPALAGSADMLVFGTGVLMAALGVYLLRSWRLLWAPLFVAALGAVALGYGGVAGMVGPALSGLALAAALFLLGGLINRIRDGARLEARIAVLSDHLLRQGPQDAVLPVEDAEPHDPAQDADEPANDEVEAVVPAAVAAVASLREPGHEDEGEVEPEEVEPEHASTEAVANDAEAVEGEAELEPDAEDISADSAEEPAESLEEAEAEAVEAPAAPVSEDAVDVEAAEAVEASDAVTAAPSEPVEDTAVEPEAPTEGPASAAQGQDTPEDVDAVAEAVDTPPETDVVAEDATEQADAPADSADVPVVDATSEPVPAVEAEAVPEADEPAKPVEPSQNAVPDAPMPGDTAPAGLDPEEAERLRTDPRYASRAIVLPPPPPMPTPSVALGEGSGEAVGHGETTTLKPSAPLPDNVIPIFAAPASSEIPTNGGVEPEGTAPTPGDDTPREPS